MAEEDFSLESIHQGEAAWGNEPTPEQIAALRGNVKDLFLDVEKKMVVEEMEKVLVRSKEDDNSPYKREFKTETEELYLNMEHNGNPSDALVVRYVRRAPAGNNPSAYLVDHYLLERDGNFLITTESYDKDGQRQSSRHSLSPTEQDLHPDTPKTVGTIKNLLQGYLNGSPQPIPQTVK